MNLLQRIEHYRKSWNLLLPHVAVPTPEDIAHWSLYPIAAVEAAIVRTSKRFAPTRLTPDFVPQQAYRYATGTARSIATPSPKGETIT